MVISGKRMSVAKDEGNAGGWTRVRLGASVARCGDETDSLHASHLMPRQRRRDGRDGGAVTVPKQGAAPTRAASFGFAFRGVRALLAAEPNARIHLLAAAAAVALGAVLRITPLEWCAVALAIALVWMAEAFNTAVETICDLLDIRRPRKGGKSHRDLINFVTDRPGHDRRYAIDASKISRDLGWTPAESFDSGLARTVDWFLGNKWWWAPIREQRYAGERLGHGQAEGRKGAA